MAQYINKDSLISHIDKWLHNIKIGITSVPLHGRQKADATLEYEILKVVRDFINTFEVIGVDIGSLEGDTSVKTVYNGINIVNVKTQKEE